MHDASNKFVDELLALLHKHLLPKDNCMSFNMYATKIFTSKVDLDYQNIHACIDGCVYYLENNLHHLSFALNVELISTMHIAHVVMKIS